MCCFHIWALQRGDAKAFSHVFPRLTEGGGEGGSKAIWAMPIKNQYISKRGFPKLYFSEIWIRNIIITNANDRYKDFLFGQLTSFVKPFLHLQFAPTFQHTSFLYSMNIEIYGSFTKAQLSMQLGHLAISMGSTWRESCVGGKLDKKVQLLRLPGSPGDG